MLQGRRGGLDPILETALRLIGLRYIRNMRGSYFFFCSSVSMARIWLTV